MSEVEMSPEAAAAGEAAATAVEELHAREEIAEAAIDARIDASTAVAGAQEAAFAAESAQVSAETALDVAESAEASAEAATEAIASVGYATAAALEELDARNEQRMREIREYVDSKIPVGPPVTEQPEFEEVEVNGGSPISDNRTGSEAEGGDSETGAGQSEKPTARYGLRHKRKNR